MCLSSPGLFLELRLGIPRPPYWFPRLVNYSRRNERKKDGKEKGRAGTAVDPAMEGNAAAKMTRIAMEMLNVGLGGSWLRERASACSR